MTQVEVSAFYKHKNIEVPFPENKGRVKEEMGEKRGSLSMGLSSLCLGGSTGPVSTKSMPTGPVGRLPYTEVGDGDENYELFYWSGVFFF